LFLIRGDKAHAGEVCGSEACVIADHTMIYAMISHGKAWESNGQLSGIT